ncbi:MAG: methyltransferase domain-containing protein [Blastocatellia bacterium]
MDNKTLSGAVNIAVEPDTAVSADYGWREQTCPLCPTGRTRLLGRRGGSAHRLGIGVVSFIYQCRGCGLIFPNPMPIPRQMAEHYGDADKYFIEHSLKGKLSAYDETLSTIEELGAKTGRLLDVGAGRGEMVRAARMRGWEAVGLEPSPNFAHFARQYSGGEVVEATLEDRTFEEDSFDVVTLGAVLEHVFNPTELLTEINRILRPGGMLWLDVPNEAGAFYKLGNAYQRFHRRDWVVNLSPTFPPYHVFGFTPRALRRLLKITGFGVVRLKTYAANAVIETGDSPVPPPLRPLVRRMLLLGELIGAGTYMDAWAIKL